MRNAEEFSGQRRGCGRVLPTHRGSGSGAGSRSGSGRIRYAHGGAPARVEPFCTVPRTTVPTSTLSTSTVPEGPVSHQGGDVGTGGPGGTGSANTWGSWGPGGVMDSGNPNTGTWPTGFPVGGRHSDVWVLICGGVAAAAAFTAAFIASGGAASHPAAPAARMPAVVSQACPAPIAGQTP